MLLTCSELKAHRAHRYAMNGTGQAVMLFCLLECLLMTAILGFDAGVLMVALWFLLGALVGLYMVLLAKWLRKQDRLHEVLNRVIEVSHITQVPVMAKTMALPEDAIRKAFRRMVLWRVLKNAHYSVEEDSLLLKEPWANVLVECQGCGARLRINIGQTLVCPHCGTAL